MAVGEPFGRIYLARYADPLGYGKSPSRFSDPRRRVPDKSFGVLYLGGSLKVCFLEAMLRDRHDGVSASLPLSEEDFETRSYAEIEVVSALKLVDLRGDRAVRMGVPTDVHRSSSHRLSRLWSTAFYGHSCAPDGVLYSSRLNAETNLAIYDRAVAKLQAKRVWRLMTGPGLAVVLDELNVAIAPCDP